MASGSVVPSHERPRASTPELDARFPRFSSTHGTGDFEYTPVDDEDQLLQYKVSGKGTVELRFVGYFDKPKIT